MFLVRLAHRGMWARSCRLVRLLVLAASAAASDSEVPQWCDFSSSGRRCTGHARNCTTHAACRWPAKRSPIAVIFSDRLVQTAMMTMTSLCRHPSPMAVLVFTRFTNGYRPLPWRYLSCRVLTFSLNEALEGLAALGWSPETICDRAPGESRVRPYRGKVLLEAEPWDKDFKHASCANHLRFYLPEFPVFRTRRRVLFVDDDVVVTKDPSTLYYSPHTPGMLVTTNCHVNVWDSTCKRFNVDAQSAYNHFFSLASPRPGAWGKILHLLKEATGGTISYNPRHFEWNFGFTLIELAEHRKVNFTARYESLASIMLSEHAVRRTSLMYGLGMPFFAYQGRVECYRRDGFYVVDGLGYVPPVEMRVAGVTSEVLARASVLHFNGDRKPWGDSAFPEYIEAMGDWGQTLGMSAKLLKPDSAAARANDSVAKPLSLVVLLSSPRTGTEWLAKVIVHNLCSRARIESSTILP